MPVAHVNGADIWYEWSAGDGPTAVLTHGFAGPTVGWPPIAHEVASQLRVLFYDVRAHGRTSVPDDLSSMTLPQCAADLAGLLDAVGVERAHVAGVSMGGMISAQFACDYPERVRSLLLCDTTAGNAATRAAGSPGVWPEADEMERYVASAFQQMAHIAEKYGVKSVVERENRYRRERDPHAHLQPVSYEEQDAKDYRNKVENMTPAGYLASARAMAERPDLTSRTPSISAPTLISCGEWDRFYPAAVRDHALIGNSRLVTVKRAAHDTLAYQPQLWKRAVLEFIADVEAGHDIRGEQALEPEAALP
jgi:pimeloyl-ACP methyl ester carboxylesterase